MKSGYLHLGFSLLFLAFSIALSGNNYPQDIGDNSSSSSLHFDLDACSSYISQGTNFDYSEFTAIETNDAACLQLSVVGGFLYRDEALRNPHSCTPGFSGSALCVSSVLDLIIQQVT